MRMLDLTPAPALAGPLPASVPGQTGYVVDGELVG
jgi:hypothetical protein